jgi:putative membrane protein
MEHARHHPATHQPGMDPPSWPWLGMLAALALLYVIARFRQPGAKPWSGARAACWYAGLLVAGIALVGPLAERAHADFAFHMWVHLLLGMLAPVLLVLGAPVTLALRALPVTWARRSVRVLASPPLATLAHPVTAAVLNVGGLAVLYLTGLYAAMHDHAVIHVLVHGHVLFAGYLFTAAIAGIDPVAHRPSFAYRAVVLVVALGAHAVLAKWLYAHPPAGVPVADARAGSLLMYYGGDAVHLILITLFCAQWYRAARPRTRAWPAVQA